MIPRKTSSRRANWLIVGLLIAPLGSGCSILGKPRENAETTGSNVSKGLPPGEMSSTLKTDPNEVDAGRTIAPPALGVDL